MRPSLIATLCVTFASVILWAGDGAVKPIIMATDEPGDAMLIEGVIYQADGKTPADHAEVYLYHTDIKGYYSETTRNSDNPRIQARFKTDAQGRFAFRSIVPGPYPDASIPAHVHMRVSHNGSALSYRELQFAGDPYLSESKVNREMAKGKFSKICKLEQKDDVLYATWNVRLD